MSVTESELRHVAALARLELHAERVPALLAEMNRILDYVGVLQQVELTGTVSSTSPSEPTPLRVDEVGAVPLEREISSFAPEERDGFFLVPRLSTHE